MSNATVKKPDNRWVAVDGRSGLYTKEASSLGSADQATQLVLKKLEAQFDAIDAAADRKEQARQQFVSSFRSA